MTAAGRLRRNSPAFARHMRKGPVRAAPALVDASFRTILSYSAAVTSAVK